MVERLTDDEMRRIQNFARTPAYARTPEQLLPEEAEADSTDGEPEDTEEFASVRNSAGAPQ
jgi:hypothetical protein